MARAPDSRDVSAFAGCVDLACETFGGEAMLSSDAFFAGRDHLVKAPRAVFDPDAYTDRGKLMDGWEPRRRRTPGHDWCIVRLGVPGRIVGVDVDTDHFLGNHPPFASVFATHAPGASAEHLRDEAEWTLVVPQFALQRGARNLASSRSGGVWTHVRLDIHPAGGVARLRVYGEPVVAAADGPIDLAALANGGFAVACSDMFFSPLENLLMPGRPVNMGGGWETRRSRPPGEDWAIVGLRPGRIERIDVETTHFKGNYPDSCEIDGLYWPGAAPHDLTRTDAWEPVVGRTKLGPDAVRTIDSPAPGPWTHLRLRIQPDGGVSRLRVRGRATDDSPGSGDALLDLLNGLSKADAVAALMRCCGSRRWAAAVSEGRPYGSRTHLFGHAEHVWWHLGDGDWHEAFGHHPRIGADVDALRAKFAAADLSAREQAGVDSASEDTLDALAAGNVAYEARYGFLFIVCATGKTATEMLALLRARMNHEPAAELRIAAGEQARITRIRLAGLVPEETA